MKRMYITLGFMLVVFIWVVSSFAQKKTESPEEEILRMRMELREQMHQRMRDHFINGIGTQDDIFQGMDALFEDAMKEMGQMSISQEFQTEWSETSSGRRLNVIPKSADQKLDISVNGAMVTIKSETKNSQTSSSFSIPGDCDGSKVKISQEKGTLFVDFPYIKSEPKKVPLKDNRRPVEPSEGDVSI